MDAQAHLISLGWAGPGHALDSRPQYKQKGHRGLAYNPALDPLKVGNTGNGLVKPLSISKRKDRFGVGKRAHEPASGTEWWLKGFENALGNIGKSESERSGTSTPTIMGSGMKQAGLYGFFIKGQIMEGTISKDLLLGHGRGRKRKSDVLECLEIDSDNSGSKKVKVTGLEVSPVRRKPETALDFATVGAFIRERDKQGTRRSGTDTKKNDIDQFAQIGKFFEESERTEKQKKKNPKSELLFDSTTVDETPESDGEGMKETKEERRARRQKRKEEKEMIARLRTNDMLEDETTMAVKKAEKKRRKAEREARKAKT